MADIQIFENSKELEKLVDETFNDAELSEPVPPTDIVAYNELRSCFDLFRLYSTKKLEIQPDFQREVVWDIKEQTRFIDSLVKQLPIPSMCFSLDYKTQQWKVIDGLQRISSIINFMKPDVWTLASLDDIHQSLRGAKNSELRGAPENDPRQLIYSTVENVSIPITVIRCDYSQASHLQYLFTIFHRLNSGGVRLNNQEIRNCIYSGDFNTALKDFDRKNSDWSEIKKRIWGKVDRFRSIELLLRAIAFSESLNNYDGNLAKFLNEFMHNKSKLNSVDLTALNSKLEKLARIGRSVLAAYPSKKISLTIVEAVLVGILVNLPKVDADPQAQRIVSFSEMLANNAFKDAARYAISSERNVKARLEVSISSFAGV